MKTEIFNTYSEFLSRKDNKLNGVSVDFAEKNPGYVKQNESNEGCWNCSDCSRCSGCSGCSHCYDCSLCYDCSRCSDCFDCFDWAGWVVTLTGKKGKELEAKTSTLFAAMMIYKASSPIRVSPTRFFENNEKAMEDIKKCAEKEYHDRKT